ncbi:MAG: phosphomannomutase [Nitrososphaerales archaeon]
MKISISGVRGIFGDDLMLHDILKFSRGFSKLLDRECVLARDTRETSKIIYQTAAGAIMEQGIDVYNLDIAPTPFAFKEARKHDAALIVTASHNPLEWNGLKFVIDGRGIFEEELEKIINEATREIKTIGREYKISSSYGKEIVDFVGKINGRPKIAVDTTGGAASGYASAILSEIGCKVTSINDGYGVSSRAPDPTSDELNEIRELVVNYKCEVGFAFDLDGDRLVLIDKNGVKLRTDLTLLLCVARAIDMHIRDFVVSVDTSKAIEDYVREKNCKIHRTKVGEANVVKQMLEHRIQAGGEGSSGGFILKDFNMCRDGILASAFISSLVGSKTYDECLALASQYHSIRGKIAVDSSLHDEIIENVSKLVRKQSSALDYIDGVTGTIDDDTWVLIRGSNTEHYIRLSVESKQEERSKSLYTKYEDKVREENEKAKRKTCN